MENKGWAQIGKNPKTAQWGLWAKLYETSDTDPVAAIESSDV